MIFRSLLNFIVESGIRRKFPSRERYAFYNLASKKRWTSGQIKLNGRPITYVDSASCFSAWKGIFEDQLYKFNSDTDQPLILDLGANIGLATLYFKSLFPKAKVLAFEPDPNIFSVLKSNCTDLDGVVLAQKAVSKSNEAVKFLPTNDDAGSLITSNHSGVGISVESIRLSELISEQDSEVEFLKIDIEGAELEVLLESSKQLAKVKRIFVEYHSFVAFTQRLDELLRLLSKNGFRYYLQSEATVPSPFVDQHTENRMDGRINIFATRSTD